jgi:microsomal dipeptidase-like Zn-dependent dipeptidase
VAAHNGARWLAMDPRPQLPVSGDVPGPDERRNPHTWPNESTKSETQFRYIKDTKGMFGHGIAGADSKQYGAVQNDAPGTSKTVAQGLQYVMDKLEGAVGLGTDWNVLLGGPGPRFGPMAIPGLVDELQQEDAWTEQVRKDRWADALAQANGVTYDRPLRDWRGHRFRDSGLFPADSYGQDGRFIWQAVALDKAAADLTDPAVTDALVTSGCGAALDMARGFRDTAGATGSDFFQAGAKARNPEYQVTGDPEHIRHLLEGIADAATLWDRMTTPGSVPLQRSTAGPLRDFDYNLDGLAHYGMLPDMLQDLKNVGLPSSALKNFFSSAECYIRVWERSVAAAATIPHPDPGGGA